MIGAAGHTGRFVVEELVRRGIEPIEIARNRADMRPVDLNDPVSLDRALVGAAAVINCAGPFLDTAEAVAEAALRAGIHYLDVTAEQASALATLDAFDAPARAAGIVVLPAVAFYGGFGDLLATAAAGDWASVDELNIYIALNHWWPTEGTRRTGARNTVQRVVVRGGRLVPHEKSQRPSTWTFGEPFGTQDIVEVPLAEMILLARHLPVATVGNFINAQPLNDLNDATTPPPPREDAMGRSRQQFAVEVVARRGGDVRAAIARGQDIYAFSAPLVVEAAQRLVTGNGHTSGAFALGSIFDARAFLAALARSYPSLEVTCG
ncbi:MAG TPA: saccharopine dehydrogenase NADP-binding domain-containing protein [Candidatus Aquilonibacter sp.]